MSTIEGSFQKSDNLRPKPYSQMFLLPIKKFVYLTFYIEIKGVLYTNIDQKLQNRFLTCPAHTKSIIMNFKWSPNHFNNYKKDSEDKSIFFPCIFSVFENKDKIILVMEHADGGELYDYINNNRLTERDARRVFRQITSAIKYCHQVNTF